MTPVPGPTRERVAAVFSGGRQGSGYLLSPYLVLTAAHVIQDAEDIRAVSVGGNGQKRCEQLWSWQNDACDVALLLADEPLTAVDTPWERALWGELPRIAPVPDCQAIGFPHARRDSADRLETEQLIGTLKPGSSLLQQGRCVLDSSHQPPGPRPGGGSPWAGFSGAAVFAAGHLVGIAAVDPDGWRSARVEATRVSTLLAIPSFISTLRQLDARIPVTVPVPGLPSNPDAEFETRYGEYIAKKHSKLTIYGIDLSNSPARWPLDMTYLSLEATATPRFAGSTVPDMEAAEELAAGIMADDPDPLSPLGRRARASATRLLGEARPRPADQALAHHERVLLRGEAGSGKTTLVQWLAVTAARQDLDGRMAYLDHRIPFVLPLRTLTRHGDRLPATGGLLAAGGCPLAGSQPAGWEARVLTAGRGLLLIDGIDEVPDAERERTRTWLRDLLAAFPGNRWLVTSRPSAVRDDWLTDDDFTTLTLSAMSPDDVAAFIRRWHRAARAESGTAGQGGQDGQSGQDGRSGQGGQAAEAWDAGELDTYESQLLTAARTQSDLGSLATSPLMCGLICALHRDRRGYLPHGRKDLYSAALSMLLIRRDRERDMAGPELREESQIELLQRLAYWLIKNGRTEMDRSRAETIIGRALPAIPEAAALGDASAVFEHFLQRSGLLREPAPDTVDFVHRTFQDFLGARAAVEEGDFGLLTEHAVDDQWDDVIRMAVALARPGERVTIFKDLLALGDRTTDQRARARVYLLAAASLEHATTLDPAVRGAVEQRTGTLIPPRTEEEARALAETGPLVLGLLPGPDQLDDVSAFHVAVAASHVKSDLAMAFLSRFATHRFLAVRAQLLWAWSRFDTAQYATEVIARLDPTGLDYTLRSDEQLAQLLRLDPRPGRLDVRDGVSAGALASYAAGNAITHLRLLNASARDLAFLTGQDTLERLIVHDCPDLVDLSALDGMPVRLLDLGSPRADIDLEPVSRLPRLAALIVGGPAGLSWSAGLLPSPDHLQSLKITGEVRAPDGLKGLGGRPLLRTLSLNRPSCPASAADWQEISGLHRLDDLSVTAASLDTLPGSMPMPAVTSLALTGGGGERVVQGALRRLPALFPRLITLAITGDMSAEGDIDLAPLRELPDLGHVYLAAGGDRVRNAEGLPSSVQLHLH